MHSVAIVVTVYRNPPRLSNLLDNMLWAGIPDVPLYIFEDPSPFPDRKEITAAYRNVCEEKGNFPLITSPEWGCMQGIIDFALASTGEDWIIYIPDDVIFTKGALWNEYAGVLAYGRDFVGGIQAPFWHAHELVDLGAMPSRESMFKGWVPDHIPQNPHWNYPGMPRKYINLNGAGFSISRKLYKAMHGWPRCTWRLDEWAGYQAWKQGMVAITLPGPPRIHYLGGATDYMPPDRPDFSSIERWKQATKGLTPAETGNETSLIMDKIQDGTWIGILNFFKSGGTLNG